MKNDECMQCPCGNFTNKELSDINRWRRINGIWKCPDCIGLYNEEDPSIFCIEDIIAINTTQFSLLSFSEKRNILDTVEDWVDKQRMTIKMDRHEIYSID